MTIELYSSTFGPLQFLEGWPTSRPVPRLPLARPHSLEKEFGSVCVQEVQTREYVFRFFIFHFFRQVTLRSVEKAEGLQSIVCLKGQMKHGLSGQPYQDISSGQFTLLNAGKQSTEVIIPADRECHVFNTYYTGKIPSEFYTAFPSYQKLSHKAPASPHFLLLFPKRAKWSLLDCIQEILFERYAPQLQTLFWELKLRQALFSQLAQTYYEEDRVSSPLEKEMAIKAQSIMTQDIRRHYSNEELAKMINWSEASLKRAFRQEFGIGMYEYLRKLRMQKAKQMLLDGELVKNVAPAVGMRPSNFTTEFKKYFGYRATELRGRGK